MTSSISDAAPSLASNIPQLDLLASLAHPSGTTRTWQSTPHPALSQPILATASADKTVNIWSLRDFRLLSTITGGHKRSIRCVGWKDYGTRFAKRRKVNPSEEDDDEGHEGIKKAPVVLATGSFDANVGIWMHNETYGKTNAGNHSGMDEDGAIDMTDSRDRDEDEEWHFSTLLTGPDSEIKSLAFSPPHYGANLLATSSRDKSVWIWEEVEEDEWETIAVLQEHTGDVKCVAWCGGARIKPQPSPQHNADLLVEDGEEQIKIIGGREILASGSYDDTIRLWRDVEEEGDWLCVGVLEGHAGTVWSVCWESHLPPKLSSESKKWEPRLASASDDLTVRIWRRQLSEAEREREQTRPGSSGPRKLPSIIRPPSSMETWEVDAVLPHLHVRSVYAVNWSSRTGLLVSCGGDGVIAVYREETSETGDGDVVMNGTVDERGPSRWKIVAVTEAAHDAYEINHVCWALRRDTGKRFQDEEVVVSTGDDGVVRVWTLPDGLL